MFCAGCSSCARMCTAWKGRELNAETCADFSRLVSLRPRMFTPRRYQTTLNYCCEQSDNHNARAIEEENGANRAKRRFARRLCRFQNQSYGCRIYIRVYQNLKGSYSAELSQSAAIERFPDVVVERALKHHENCLDYETVHITLRHHTFGFRHSGTICVAATRPRLRPIPMDVQPHPCYCKCTSACCLVNTPDTGKNDKFVPLNFTS